LGSCDLASVPALGVMGQKVGRTGKGKNFTFANSRGSVGRCQSEKTDKRSGYGKRPLHTRKKKRCSKR